VKFWNVDLSTQDGAEGAAQMGGYACFVMAALDALGIAMVSGVLASGGDRIAATGVLAFGLGEILIFLVAGFRLRAGTGVVWGSAAAVVLVIEIVAKLATFAISVALFINVLLLIFVVNGIRGARALRSGVFDADEAAEIFG
jgi:hypothetical protein